jgi:rhodanese-related sulfurtransferase
LEFFDSCFERSRYYASLLLIALAFSVLFSACSIQRLSRKGIYKELEAKEFLDLALDSNVTIIDLRTVKEFERSRIKGAVNASYFGGNFSQLIDSLHLDPTKTTLIYCETQHRSLFATKILYKKGFTQIIDLKKGMAHWRKAQFPFEE